ncbi:hypothetical protein [Aliivibrio fischeri]|uniref:hypothetical protein n=1 Tax=Aliivibrio fischeri TaxID=668 RepID=UPI00084BE3AC|nr:hypothetical protein [Aliivibrio fischeri]OED51064.1 hypothetical protein BEI47_10490 [Aliivibrio fischeri]
MSSKWTIAEQLMIKSKVNELGAFEMSVELAVSISEHHNYSSYRFEDNSELRISISDEHEITVMLV